MASVEKMFEAALEKAKRGHFGKLQTRLTPLPLAAPGVYDRVFPELPEHLCFDSYLTGLTDGEVRSVQFNFTFNGGLSTSYKESVLCVPKVI